MPDALFRLYRRIGKAWAVTYNKPMNPEQPALDNQLIDKTAQKHFLAVFFLSFMWGMFGVDRFYIGKIWTGLLKLLTFGGFGFWIVIDLGLILSGNMRDKQGRELLEFQRYKAFAAKTTLIFSLIFSAVLIIGGGLLIYLAYIVMNSLLQGELPPAIQNLIPGGLPTTGIPFN